MCEGAEEMRREFLEGRRESGGEEMERVSERRFCLGREAIRLGWCDACAIASVRCVLWPPPFPLFQCPLPAC